MEHSILWHVYPLGFTGAPIREAHDSKPRLRELVNWLDYAVELGVNGLLMGPIFTSTSHGYDTLNFYEIDPRLGTRADWDYFVQECRKRGLGIMLDGVFNHVGREHPDAAELVDFTETGEPKLFEGHRSLLALKHHDPKIERLVEDVMCYWLEAGATSWRLDASNTVPAEFWGRVLPRVRERFPNTWFIGEAIHGDYEQFVAESTIDSLTQYRLWKAVWSSLKDRNFFELEYAFEQNNDYLNFMIPNTFIGNHDVTRIATMVGRDAAVLALTVLMTVGGVPSIYYGDEQAYTALKTDRTGGDDAIRPMFDGGHDEEMFRLHQQLIGLRRRHPWLTEARASTVHLTNEEFRYRVESGDDHLFVTLDVRDGYRALVQSPDGTELFSFRTVSQTPAST